MTFPTSLLHHSQPWVHTADCILLYSSYEPLGIHLFKGWGNIYYNIAPGLALALFSKWSVFLFVLSSITLFEAGNFDEWGTDAGDHQVSFKHYQKQIKDDAQIVKELLKIAIRKWVSGLFYLDINSTIPTKD